MRIDEGGSIAADTAYRLIAAQRTFRVNADGSTSPVVNVTAQSQKYHVQYTWTILAQTWDQDGGPPAIALKTEQVNAICAHAHVQDFRTEQDHGPSGQLFNYAVITVGTDDGLVTDDARVRMDHIGLPSAFTAIDMVWKRIAAALG